MNDVKDLAAHNKKIRADVCKEIYDLLDAGICPLCEHSEDNCYKWCGEEGYEVETLKTWLENQFKEQKSLKEMLEDIDKWNKEQKNGK